MSARAAARLEMLGFKHVFRYTAGKADWLANGWPIAGEAQDAPTARNLAQPDVPVCSPEDRIGDIAPRVAASGWEICVVVNAKRVVLGLLRKEHLTQTERLAVEVMECAPRTYRLNAKPETMLGYLERHDRGEVLVTKASGELIGVVTAQQLRDLGVKGKK